jgi:hypothetical protein
MAGNDKPPGDEEPQSGVAGAPSVVERSCHDGVRMAGQAVARRLMASEWPGRPSLGD